MSIDVRRIPMTDEMWENFANAIICQAAEDYRSARKKLRDDPENFGHLKTVKEVERFFRSQWYCQLTSADGMYIFSRLKSEQDQIDDALP